MPSVLGLVRRPLAAALAGVLALACSRPAEPAAWSVPTLPDRTGVDPFKLEAIDAALAAVQRDEAGALLELGKVYDANGLGELADEIYRHCLEAPELEPRARVRLLYLRALNLEALGRAEEALATYQSTLELEQDYAPTHWRCGDLLVDFGRLDEARAAYQRALALEPQSVQANLGLARTQLLGEDPAGAIATLTPLVERVSDERFVHGLLARAYRALGDTARAEQELRRDERSERISMGDPRAGEVGARAVGVLAATRRANAAMLDGRNEEAIALLVPMLARVPDDLALLQMVAKAYLAAGQHDQALAVLEPAMKTHPDQFKLELFCGLALDGKKQTRRAMPHLERACELNPGYGPAWSARGEALARLARFPEAEQALVRAGELGEEDLRTRLLLGQMQLEQAAHERALATARAAVAEFPRAASAWSFQAEALAKAGQRDEARAALAEAERLNPRYERLAAVRALLGSEGAR